jgi:hypothetical protein
MDSDRVASGEMSRSSEATAVSSDEREGLGLRGEVDEGRRVESDAGEACPRPAAGECLMAMHGSRSPARTCSNPFRPIKLDPSPVARRVPLSVALDPNQA